MKWLREMINHLHLGKSLDPVLEARRQQRMDFEAAIVRARAEERERWLREQLSNLRTIREARRGT